MAKFVVYGLYSVGVYLGVVEADTEAEALQIGSDKFEGDTIGLCWQCTQETGDNLTCGSVSVEATDDSDTVKWEREV